MQSAFLSDDDILRLLDLPAVATVLDEAFSDWARGQAQCLARQRVDCGPVKLSTMGGIWLARQVAGLKSYPTADGQFDFAVTLFDLQARGQALTLDGAALTRLRTGAMVALAASRAAVPRSAKLALVGGGLQGTGIAQGLARVLPLVEVAVVDPAWGEADAAAFANKLRLPVRAVPAREAVEGADIVVTATRSKTPVFDGAWLKPGAFVAAIGTSLPNGRELDDVTLARAGRVLVEWKPQSLVEAGEVVLGMRAGALHQDSIFDLPGLYGGGARWRHDASEIVVFKSVGIGLADVAAAWLARSCWRAAQLGAS